MPRPRRDALTLALLLTVLMASTGWVGWQYQIVRHRRAARSQIVANGGKVFVGKFELRESPRVKTIRPADFHYKISTVRKWFGDELVDVIGFNRQLTAADSRAIEAFPESEVRAIP